MNREELLESYIRIRGKVLQLLAQQDKYQEVCNQLSEAQKKEKSIREEHPMGTVGCIIWLLVSVFVYIIFRNMFDGVVGVVAVVIVAFIINAIDEAIKKGKSDNAESIEKANKFHFETVVKLEQVVRDQKQVIDTLWESEEMIMFEKLIPDAYKTIDALNFFIQSLENRRADTDKELFNLYEDYISKQQMIELQNQQLATQNEQLAATQQANALNQEQLNKLKDIQRNQKKLSSQQKYGNVVSTINLLKK